MPVDRLAGNELNRQTDYETDPASRTLPLMAAADG